MPIKYMGQCSEHKTSFVPNICSEVELFRTYKLPKLQSVLYTIRLKLLHFVKSVNRCHFKIFGELSKNLFSVQFINNHENVAKISLLHISSRETFWKFLCIVLLHLLWHLPS